MSSSSPLVPKRITRRSAQKLVVISAREIDWNGYAKLDSLSSELLDRIIHEISAITRRQDLLELLRIRPLHAAALRHVWRRLAFDLAEVTKNERLLRALHARPDLGENIRRISVRQEAFSAMPSSSLSGLERAIKLLENATALTDLEIKCRLRHAVDDDARPAELEDALSTAFSTFSSTLKRFVLNPSKAECYEDVQGGRTPTPLPMTTPFLHAFSAFSRLTILDLWEVSFLDSPIQGTPLPTFRLTKLVMTHVMLPAEQLAWLTSSLATSRSLVELNLEDVTPGSEKGCETFIAAMSAFLSAIAPTLRSLSVEDAVEGLFADEELAIPLFGRFASLQRLVLDVRDILPAAWNALPTDRLRQSLHMVDLQILSSIPPGSVTATLRKLQPALKRVAIVTHRGTQLIQAGMTAPDVWTWSRADRRTLRSVCITHGVPLEIDGIFEPDDVELSSADEADIAQIGNEEDEGPGEDPDDLFVLDDERRARYEEELTADYALIEEAKRRGDADSADEFMDAVSSEGDDL